MDDPSSILDSFKRLPEWDQSLRSHVMLYRTFYNGDTHLLSTVFATMQKLHPGEYTLTMDGKDVKIVFENPNKELLWKIKYS